MLGVLELDLPFATILFGRIEESCDLRNLVTCKSTVLVPRMTFRILAGKRSLHLTITVDLPSSYVEIRSDSARKNKRERRPNTISLYSFNEKDILKSIISYKNNK